VYSFTNETNFLEKKREDKKIAMSIIKFILLKPRITNCIARAMRPFYKPFRNRKNLQHINQLISERFEKTSLNLENRLVVDLGANRGDFSRWALEQKAIVLAFEPDAVAFTHLVRRMKSFSNFFPVNAAVSNQTSIAKLFMHKNRNSDPLGHSISSSLLVAKANIDPNQYQTVFCVDFEFIVNNFQIRVLKIDIEGAEGAIWKTIESYYKKIDYLVMEIHKTNNKDFISDVVNFISKNGLNDNWKIDWQ
jgi:FkbM family methyltransferase